MERVHSVITHIFSLSLSLACPVASLSSIVIEMNVSAEWDSTQGLQVLGKGSRNF